jgi:putative acetyltransferase
MENYIIRKINKEDNPEVAQLIRAVLWIDIPKRGEQLMKILWNFNAWRIHKPKIRFYYVVENNGRIVEMEFACKWSYDTCELQKNVFFYLKHAYWIWTEMMVCRLKCSEILVSENAIWKTMPFMLDAQKLYTLWF